MAHVYLSLGSNLNDRENNIQTAINLLKQNDVKIIKVSPVYETEPREHIKLFGISCALNYKQSNFLNCVVFASTDATPEKLLSKILGIEKSIGRKRILGVKNLPRKIDIDILFYDSMIINQPMLKIPHPKLHLRAFVLVPFCDVEPNYIHPKFNKSIKELTDRVDKKGVMLWQKKEMKISA